MLPPPAKIPTPYGGQLTWTLPGGNLLYVHIKDKNKIRHKKRWSQVTVPVVAKTSMYKPQDVPNKNTPVFYCQYGPSLR